MVSENSVLELRSVLSFMGGDLGICPASPFLGTPRRVSNVNFLNVNEN